MSDLKHTPEPWVQNLVGNMIKANNLIIAVTGSDKTTFNTDVNNAARIVDCVNACKGKPNPERWIKEAEAMLQKVYDFEHPEMKIGESKLEFILKLAAERDKLKAKGGQP